MLVKDFMNVLLGRYSASFHFVFTGWKLEEALCINGYDALVQLHPEILEMLIENIGNYETQFFDVITLKKEYITHFIIYVSGRELVQDVCK